MGDAQKSHHDKELVQKKGEGQVAWHVEVPCKTEMLCPFDLTL